jgi:hypothetical protein
MNVKKASSILIMVACAIIAGCSRNETPSPSSDAAIERSSKAENPNGGGAKQIAEELEQLAVAPKPQPAAEQAPPAPPGPAANPAAPAAPAVHPAAATREPYRPADPEIPIDELPASASLSQRKGMAWMYQRGNWWCIPAAIENCFRYVGIWDVKQDQIVRSYVNIYGKGDWFNFNSGARAAAALVDLKSRGLEFEVGTAPDLETFHRKVKHAIANNWPCLIAYEIGGGNAHVVNVVAYGEAHFDVYDPATAKMEFLRLSELKVGSKPGWLILRPIKKKN